MSHHALISKCFEKKNPTFAFTYLLKSPKSQNNANHTKERIQYENIKKIYINGAHFGLLVQLKTLCLERKNQECLQASIKGKKSKKRVFVFRLQYGQKKKALNVIFSPKK